MGLLVALGAAGEAAKHADAIAKIWERLNKARTCLLEVANKTDHVLRITHHHHAGGGFAEPPSHELPANTVDVFGSQSKSFSVGTGTEGWITYRVGDFSTKVGIRWNNPYIGSNSAGTSADGDLKAVFEFTAIAGAGNDAHMKYELRQVAPIQRSATGHHAAGFHFVMPHSAAVSSHTQDQWRFCEKCHGMFYDGFPEKGRCPSGGGHRAAGFNFVLLHDMPPRADTQNQWRFCEKCHGMFYDGFPEKGRCPSGGGHRAAGFNFMLPHGMSGSNNAQEFWRFCKKCGGMFYDGFPEKGRCPGS